MLSIALSAIRDAKRNLPPGARWDAVNRAEIAIVRLMNATLSPVNTWPMTVHKKPRTMLRIALAEIRMAKAGHKFNDAWKSTNVKLSFTEAVDRLKEAIEACATKKSSWTQLHLPLGAP